MIDFDDLNSWENQLNFIMKKYMSDEVCCKLTLLPIKYYDVTASVLLKLLGKDKMKQAIDDILVWIKSSSVIGYHGTRLTEQELDSLEVQGILPLSPEKRENRIAKIIKGYKISVDQLRKTIYQFGEGVCNGKRKGQVHLTFSRSGLINDFPQYLLYGSEFDRKVICDLIGENEGKKALKQYGYPKIIKVSIPGRIALEAAHPYLSIDRMRDKDTFPHIVRELLNVWVFRFIKKDFDPKQCGLDCGFIFKEKIPANWILQIRAVDDRKLIRSVSSVSK